MVDLRLLDHQTYYCFFLMLEPCWLEHQTYYWYFLMLKPCWLEHQTYYLVVSACCLM